jgi:excisionase family DNA binding protein
MQNTAEAQTHPPKMAYRIPEASKATGLPVATFWRAIREKRLQARKSGRSTFVLADDLRAFLEAQPSRN